MLQIRQHDIALGTTEDVGHLYTNRQASAAKRHLKALCDGDHCCTTVFYLAPVPYQRPKKEKRD